MSCRLRRRGQTLLDGQLLFRPRSLRREKTDGGGRGGGAYADGDPKTLL